MRSTFLLILFALFSTISNAQEVVQVVTKTIEKTYNYQDGYELNVEGQKAEIFIETWDKKEISIHLEISAKHPDRAIAEEELESVNFVAERIKNKIYIRNYRYGNTSTNSILSVTYRITLPEDCPVYVKNYFGSSSINNLSNRLRVFGEFSQIDINNVEGFVDIQTRFGDIIGEKISGNVTINARRSDITLYEIGGNYQINAQYGILKLQPTTDLLALNINAEKSEIYLFDDHLDHFAYRLTATHGEIDAPSNLLLLTLEDTPEVKSIQFRPPGQETYVTITVAVTFGDVHVQKTPTQF